MSLLDSLSTAKIGRKLYFSLPRKAHCPKNTNDSRLSTYLALRRPSPEPADDDACAGVQA